MTTKVKLTKEQKAKVKLYREMLEGQIAARRYSVAELIERLKPYGECKVIFGQGKLIIKDERAKTIARIFEAQKLM